MSFTSKQFFESWKKHKIEKDAGNDHYVDLFFKSLFFFMIAVIKSDLQAPKFK